MKSVTRGGCRVRREAPGDELALGLFLPRDRALIEGSKSVACSAAARSDFVQFGKVAVLNIFEPTCGGDALTLDNFSNLLLRLAPQPKLEDAQSFANCALRNRQDRR